MCTLLLLSILCLFSFHFILQNQEKDEQEWFDILQRKISEPNNSESTLNFHKIRRDNTFIAIKKTRKFKRIIEYSILSSFLLLLTLSICFYQKIKGALSNLRKRKISLSNKEYYQGIALSIILYIIAWVNYVFFPLHKLRFIFVSRDSSELFSIIILIFSFIILQLTMNLIIPNLKSRKLRHHILPHSLMLFGGILFFLTFIFVAVLTIDFNLG